ncbi:ras-related protein rab-37 [Anaeramoeba ignava]|uniref:Ras-related protein rab-37 n=1 Tax=Anaeramoeba ignava TaxID=1746090 RepID=A0A9Q0LF09_ANAIG|nr:ras-related protein rab-37 [Anaeramoeba ignava]
MDNQDPNEFTLNPFKIVLLGETGVGKTLLALQFCEGISNETDPTIAVAFHTKTIEIDEKEIKIQIWDTAGQEMYRSLTPMYIRNAQAAIVVYDITNKESFEKLDSWINEMLLLASKNVLVAIVGNKIDLDQIREIPTERGEEYSQMKNFLFYETSAKTGECVNLLFLEIVKKLGGLKKQEEKKVDQNIKNLEENEKKEETKKSGCC